MAVGSTQVVRLQKCRHCVCSVEVKSYLGALHDGVVEGLERGGDVHHHEYGDARLEPVSTVAIKSWIYPHIIRGTKNKSTTYVNRGKGRGTGDGR